MNEWKSESSGYESKQSTSQSDIADDEADDDDNKDTKKEIKDEEDNKDDDTLQQLNENNDEKSSKNEKDSHKNNLDDTLSYPNSPINDSSKMDTDTALEEGYGTDDSITDDIDLERRKAFVDLEHNSSLNEETMEDEDDGDTQIPNNISVDSLIRGKVRMRGGLSATPGKYFGFKIRASNRNNSRNRGRGILNIK